MIHKNMSSGFVLTALLLASAALEAQVTHITNTGFGAISDGQLNILKEDPTDNNALDILSLQRGTSGTAQPGIGGSILFRNETSNGGYISSGKITSTLTNATIGNIPTTMRFDVYLNGSTTKYMFLNNTGLGINTTDPLAALDVHTTSTNPAHFRGVSPMWMGLYENNEYRGYIGSYSGALNDVDFGTGGSNATGKLHLTIQALPKLTIDAAGKVGIATISPTTILDVQGPTAASTHVVKGMVNYTGAVDVRAVEGHSTPADGYGYGGFFTGAYRGVYGLGSGGAYSGASVIGVYGQASGTAGTRIGIYGTATGGTANWAGFFASGHVYVTNDLRIGSGASDGATGYKVAIDGKVIAEELRVQNSTLWPDYVFHEDYDLKDLRTVDSYIKAHGHLPGIPAAEIIDAEGFDVGGMQIKAMEKIEELTLYLIRMQGEIDQIRSENAQLRAEVEELRK